MRARKENKLLKYVSEHNDNEKKDGNKKDGNKKIGNKILNKPVKTITKTEPKE